MKVVWMSTASVIALRNRFHFFLALTRTVQEEMFGNEVQCKLCAVSGVHVSAHSLRIECLSNET